MPKVKKIELNVSRKNGHTVLSFSIPSEIEALLKAKSAGQQLSKNWITEIRKKIKD